LDGKGCGAQDKKRGKRAQKKKSLSAHLCPCSFTHSGPKQGFKSYLSLVDLEEFSPGFNIICGRNGAF
jgi:hypothetical protein